MNMLTADAPVAAGVPLTVQGRAITLNAMQAQALRQRPACGVVIGLRPERVHFADAGVPGRLTLLEPTGPDTYAFVDSPIGRLVSRVAGTVARRVGDVVHLDWDAADLHLFDEASGVRIAT